MAFAKFQFENTFSTGKEGYNPEREALELKLSEAREAGFQAGVQEGRRQALSEIEAQTASTLATLVNGISELMNDRLATESRLREEAIKLAYMISSKLAPALIKEQPFTELESLIADCLAAGHKEPKIVITVAEVLKEGINQKIHDILAASGFNGEISIVSDPSFNPQDCAVSWPNGGAKRDLSVLSAEIHRRIEQYLGHEIELPEQDLTSDPLTDENLAKEPSELEDEISADKALIEEAETAKEASENDSDALSIEGENITRRDDDETSE